jgi:hypothetical protein
MTARNPRRCDNDSLLPKKISTYSLKLAMSGKYGGACPGAGQKGKEQPIAGPLNVFSVEAQQATSLLAMRLVLQPPVNNSCAAAAEADWNPYSAANHERMRQ